MSLHLQRIQGLRRLEREKEGTAVVIWRPGMFFFKKKKKGSAEIKLFFERWGSKTRKEWICF